MTFENEETYYRAEKEGTVEEVERKYDQAYRRLMDSTGKGKRYPNIINGEERYTDSDYVDTSPHDTTLEIGRFQRATREDAEEAIRAAVDAFHEWEAMDWQDRVSIMEKAYRLMRERKYDIAAAVTLDNGKNRQEAMADVDEAIDFINFYCLQMRENDGYRRKTYPPFPEEDTESVLRPYGAWAVICPFNFPSAITTGMTSGCLVTGNTVVMKPPSPVPLPPYMVARVMLDAGVPPGAVNYLSGAGSVVGDVLVQSPDISGLVFTGSREVGYHLLENQIKKYPRPVVAEMGGKNPIIVTSNADMDKAVPGTVNSAFGYGGQKCSACSRIYLEEGIYQEFMDRFLKETRKLTVGDPSERGNFMGPVVHQEAYEDFKKYAEMGRRDGKMEAGGNVLTDGGRKKGYYVEPTVVTGLPEDHYMVKNELFLPIVVVQRYSTLDEAIRKVNDVDYGLTAGIFTESEEEIERFFDRTEAGVVYSNRTKGGSTGSMVGGQAFGGWKDSGSTGKGTGSYYYLPQFMREQSRTRVRE
ncbi:MAG: aldehyde dehydrogenase family protein [Methanomassiliicoccales archaeon]